MFLKTRSFDLFLIVILVLVPAPAFAYLDPGTGSMVLQVLLAGIAGIGVLFKMFWHRIRAFFTLKPLSAVVPNLDETDQDSAVANEPYSASNTANRR